MPRRGTYSIVARDPETGALGVAVQSHWFSVGSIVSWARAGVAAVATQSIAEVSYGPLLLDACVAGEPVDQALARLMTLDKLAHVRQVAVVDTGGEVAATTGSGCIPFAGQVIGDGYSCQANMMAREGVPEAMQSAFVSAQGDLADRLLAALDGAEAHGGDVRGRQSAAMRVVPAEGDAWAFAVDLRVEDHPEPLEELRRLLTLQRAYDLANEADQRLGAGDSHAANELYRRAAEIAPESDELLFWAGLALFQGGAIDAGLDAVQRAAAVTPGWLDLLDRLSPELAPAAPAVRQALGRAAG